ncbi:MAG: hypothetical protein Fur0023_19310 [Bacteroidia bacterium]
MKKQLLTLAASAVCISFSHAQLTLTQSNHAPIPGDMDMRKQIDTTANIRNILNISGSGVTWDFTGTMYSNGYGFTDYYVNPTSLPGTATYTNAGATVALSDSGGFYKVSATKIEYLGDIRPGEMTDFTSNPPDFMHYPFAYGSSFTDIGSGNMTAQNMPPFILNGTITVYADGEGTLILPSNPNIVYNNVLKVHWYATLSIQGTGSLSVVTGTQTMDNTDYYIAGQKFPIFSAHYNRTIIPAFGVNDFNFDGSHINTITLGVNTLNEQKISIYPNPAKETVFISNANNLPLHKIIVTDILGKNVITMDINDNRKNIELSVGNLNPGVYFIKIIKDNGIQTIKFIKE